MTSNFNAISVRSQILPIPDVVVNEGENATLTCIASGVPAPTVEWKKEGVAYSNQKVIFIYRHAMRT